MVLNLLFSHDVILSEYDGYHPFLQAFDLIMEATWVGECIFFDMCGPLC